MRSMTGEEFAAIINEVGYIPTEDSYQFTFRVAELAAKKERERCARIAENVKGGYTANIRTSKDEQEFSRDKDGPWVLNSDVAKAIRRS